MNTDETLQRAAQAMREGRPLGKGEMTFFMEELARGILSEERIIDFLTALRKKGESAEDILEAAIVMRRLATKIVTTRNDLLDTCGTGGDGLKTINVSTLAALTASAAGVPVAKHGNRSVSSASGSADLLEGLGIKIHLTPSQVAQCIEETNFGFMFAPFFHPAMKFAASARRKIAGRTLFNCLGPLSNPAQARHHLLGVYSEDLLLPVCQALQHLGARHAIVVHGENGLDEISLSGTTLIAEFDGNKISTRRVRPEDFGLKSVALETLVCPSPQSALAAARDVLNAKSGPAFDFTVLNAGFALLASDSVPDLRAGIERSQKLLKNGNVLKQVERLVKITNSFLSPT